jgi:hypothetical protein
MIAELVGDDGIPLHSKDIGDFARAHGLVVVTVADVRRRAAATSAVSSPARARRRHRSPTGGSPPRATRRPSGRSSWATSRLPTPTTMAWSWACTANVSPGACSARAAAAVKNSLEQTIDLIVAEGASHKIQMHAACQETTYTAPWRLVRASKSRRSSHHHHAPLDLIGACPNNLVWWRWLS